MRVNVGLAQIYPKIGDVKANLAKHLEYIERAAAAGVDLLVFPELSLTGYQVQDLVPEVAHRAPTPTTRPSPRCSKPAKSSIWCSASSTRTSASASTSPAPISPAAKWSTSITSSTCRPTSMFDEGRYFDQGEHVRAFDTRFGRVGMLICEDFWHMSPAYLLWLDGADLLIFVSSSPSRGLDAGDRLSGTRWVELVNQAYGSMFTNYVIHCNRVGYEDGKNFWGGSSIVDPNGEFLLHGTYFDEALLTQTIDLNQLHRTRSRLPLLRDERPTLVQRELARILTENPS